MANLHLLRPGAAGAHAPGRFSDSFDQERRDVLDSVMSALSSSVPDPDQMAACARLLQHLSEAPPVCAA